MTALVGTRIGLPGLALPDRVAAPRPDRLLATGTLLLSGTQPGVINDLPAHRAHWGEQPVLDLDGLVAAALSIALKGAGGAGFPTDRKLASMAGRRVGSVIVNGSEGEWTSAKDGVLLAHTPHLVLDGAAAVARALGAKRVVVRLAGDRPTVAGVVRRSIEERRHDGLRYELSLGPNSFIGGEATAVIRSLSEGPAAPADLGLPPRAPRRLGSGKHQFLSNTETFARLAVASRGDVRRSALLTASGAVERPGVLEVPERVSVGQVADAIGLVGSPRFLITGGWHGAWVRWPAAAAAPLTREGISSVGGRWGAGAFVWLPDDLDPRLALAAIVRDLAGETAGQCGPCVSGMPALAGALARARASAAMPPEVDRMLTAVDGRGLCAHPTATAAAVRSAWTAITADQGGAHGR